MNGLEQVYTILLLILAVGFVVLLAYFTTLFIGKNSSTFLHKGNIKVLERAGIGMQITIQVVKVGGKVYILAIQGKQITLLDTVEAEEWSETAQDQLSNQSGPLLNQDFKLGKQLKDLIKRPITNKGEDHNTNGQDKRNL